jgi:hypothetical protein
VVANHILLPPASLAEFSVTGPSLKVKSAVLSTLKIDTGPDGDNDSTRPILAIKASNGAAEPALRIANTSLCRLPSDSLGLH